MTPRFSTLALALEHWVHTTPHAMALIEQNQSLTYAQLWQASNTVMQQLKAYVPENQGRVGLAMPRSINAVVAIVAVWRLGACYIPLSPKAAFERSAALLTSLQAHCVLATHEHAAFNKPVIVPNCTPSHAMYETATEQALAYIIATSGTTGTPKAVGIAPNTVMAFHESFSAITAPYANMMATVPLVFDISLLEIACTLLSGKTCVLFPDQLPEPQALYQTMYNHQLECAWLTGTIFNQYIDANIDLPVSMRALIVGGEPVSADHMKRAIERHPHVVFYNGYGPTEATILVTAERIHKQDIGHRVPIGKPLPHVRMAVCDEHLNDLGLEQEGDLYISGECLAVGYLNNAEQTEQKFITRADGERWYQTGDRARFILNHAQEWVLDCLGRDDDQIKLNGVRLQLSDIEACLLQHERVKQAVVLCKHEKSHATLHAFIQTHDAQPINEQALHALLLTQFSDSVKLSSIDYVVKFEANENGKINRNVLKPQVKQRPVLKHAYAQPTTPQEQAIVQAFESILSIQGVGATDSFFDLGGTSMQVLALCEQLAVNKYACTPTMVYEYANARAIVKQLNAASVHKNTVNVKSRPLREPIAIVGMAGRFPGAASIDILWEKLLDQRDLTTHFSPDELEDIMSQQRNYVPVRGVLENVDAFDAPLFGVTPAEAEMSDPQHRILLEVAYHALEHAGLTQSYAERVGVFVGKYNNSYYENHVRYHTDKIERYGHFATSYVHEKDYLATFLAYRLNLKGPAINVQTACSTSLVAICQAIESLQAGSCDAALAGGISLTIPTRSGHVYQEGGMLSANGETRSFDAHSTGTVFSDGAGLVVLMRLSDAIAQRRTIYATLEGWAVNNDGANKASFTAPSVAGQREVIEQALARAEVTPASVSYIEAHGTGTPLGDPIELAALRQVFGSAQEPYCAIGSIKANTGHMIIAAGVGGVIKMALSLYHRKIPGLVHFETPTRQFDAHETPFYFAQKTQDWNTTLLPRRGGVTSLGVGGTNAHVIMQEYAPNVNKNAEGLHQYALLPMSAHTETALHAQQRLLEQALEHVSLQDASYTLFHGRQVHRYRSCWVGQEHEPIHKLHGVYEVTSEPRVVFMFPGQGSQSADRGKALYAEVPLFRTYFDQLSAYAQEFSGWCLSDVLRGTSALDVEQTLVAQPLIFATSLAMAQTLSDAGVVASALLGHSVGEFAAAAFAGVLSWRDAMFLVCQRAKHMQALPAGAMLSVRASAMHVQAMLQNDKTLSLAAINGPQACVVSGPFDVIEAFEKKCVERHWPHQRLHTSHAFHSSMLDPMLLAFEQDVASVQIKAPRIPIISSLTGFVLTEQDLASPAYFARHARETVLFSQAVATAQAYGDVFVELGTRPVLASLAPQTLEQHRACFVITQGNHEVLEWFQSLAKLWCLGVSLNDTLFCFEHAQFVALPLYAFDTHRYWLQAPAEKPLLPQVHAAEKMVSVDAFVREAVAPVSNNILFDLEALTQKKQINQHASFAELGIDSLALTSLALLIQKKYGLVFSLRELQQTYVTPFTLQEEMNMRLFYTKTTKVSLTASQLEVLNACMMGDDANAAFLLCLKFELNHVLHVDALKKAFDQLALRHDVLRASIDVREKVFCIGEQAHVLFEHVVASEETYQNDVERLSQKLVSSAIDLEKAPLWRVVYVQNTTCSTLLIVLSHVIADGFSLHVFSEELGELYNACCEQRTPKLKTAHRLQALVQAMSEPNYCKHIEQDIAYFKNMCASPLPSMLLPTDRARPKYREYTAAYTERFVVPDVYAQWKKYANQQRVSVFGLLCSTLAQLLSEVCKTKDVIFGIPMAGQMMVDFNHGVAHALNTLPLRLNVNIDSNEQFLKDTQNTIHDVLEHGRITYGALLPHLNLERSTSLLPLVSVLFNFDKTHDPNRVVFNGHVPQQSMVPRHYENFEWSINVYEEEGGLRLTCHYASHLFEQRTIEQWLQKFEQLATQWAKPQRILYSVNEGSRTLNAYSDSVVRIIERQVETAAQRIAIQDAQHVFTYEQLWQRAEVLAQQLMQRGVLSGDRVLIACDRHVGMMVALLGTVLAGATYVPLDKHYPQERMDYVAQSSQPRLCVTDEASLFTQFETLLIDTTGLCEQVLTPSQPVYPGLSVSSDHALYAIYTSGSTGNPKGVLVSHDNVVNLYESIVEKPGMSQHDTILAVTTLSFDIAVLELWLPLMCGARIVLASRELIEQPDMLIDCMQRERVTMMQATPSLWRVLVGRGLQFQSAFTILCGGEALSRSLADSLCDTGAQVFNMYGPTETTVWSTCARVKKNHPIVLGEPLHHTQLYVVDANARVVQLDESGELYIGGRGVALGYLNDQARTQERFIQFQTPSGNIERVYKTGDAVRMHEAGALEYVGRLDHQVKIRGHRIELGEIESAAQSLSDVVACLATVQGEHEHAFLVLWVLLKEQASIQVADVLKQLAQKLPAYMLPSRVQQVSAFPLLPNGKIDRSACAHFQVDVVEPVRAVVAPVTPLEIKIADIFTQVLALNNISKHETFFDVGGHSIAGMEALSMIEDETKVRLSPRVLLEKNIEEIAWMIEQQQPEAHKKVKASSGFFGRMMRRLVDER